MKYEVINISTTTETYIANNVLTHNKGVTPTITNITVPMTMQFGSNYSPQYPFSVYFTVDYDNFSAPDKRVEFVQSSPISVANSSQLTQNLTLRIYNNNWTGRMPYTASAKVRDNKGVYSSGSTQFTYAVYSNYYGVSPNCLVPETLITKYSGNFVYLKYIEVGDELLTIDPITMKYEKSIVTHKQSFFENELVNINEGLLKCSNSHNHIVKREGEWIVKKTYELLIGDIMLKNNLEEIVIDNIQIIT